MYAKDKCADLLYDFTYTEIEYDVGILPRVKLQMEETEAVLVCNDLGSGTVKVKEAREQNVPIISEEDFLALLKKAKK